MLFICLEQIFHGDFFYLESYKQLDNLFRKLSILFVKVRSKITYYFWKVSASLSKLDGANVEGFLGKRSFFLVESMSSRLFLDIWQMFFWTLKADCQNCVFICTDKLLLEKFYSWKNVQFDSFFRTGTGAGGGVQNSVEKTVFWRKIVRVDIRKELNVSKATFWGKTRFSEKFPVNKFFQTFSIVLVFCLFLAYLSEMRPCVQMKFLRKFFNQMNVYELFSELEQIFVVLCQQYFNRLSNLRFICLD